MSNWYKNATLLDLADIPINDLNPAISIAGDYGIFGQKSLHSRGYLSQKLVTKLLQDFGIDFLDKPRPHMENKLMRLHARL